MTDKQTQQCDRTTDPRSIFAGMLLDLLPPAILAAGIIKACGKLSRENPEMAMRVLQNSWLEISRKIEPLIKAESSGRFAASAVLLESYFGHRGDWAAMERSMTEMSPVDPVLTARVVDVISRGLSEATTRVK